MSDSVKAYYLKTFGPVVWDQREHSIAKLWKTIQEKTLALDIDFKKVRIYQDGLPVCGFEGEIARELAKAGSSNHQLIVELVGRGAALMGTEDSQLLIREYQLHQQARDSLHSLQENTEEAARILEARDRFIANRIDKTLQDGEIGLLFMGTAHRLEVLNSTGICIESLPGNIK